MSAKKPRPWIEVATSRAKRLQEAREAVARKEDDVAEAVRAALAEGATASDVAKAVGLSRARVYQIRDGRRT